MNVRGRRSVEARPKGLTIALSKGKLLGPVLQLMKQAGYDSPGLSTESRKLVFDCAGNDARFLIVRPTDVPTYVEHGAADVGVVGKDVLLEQGSDVYEPLDLKVGACRSFPWVTTMNSGSKEPPALRIL